MTYKQAFNHLGDQHAAQRWTSADRTRMAVAAVLCAGALLLLVLP